MSTKNMNSNKPPTTTTAATSRLHSEDTAEVTRLAKTLIRLLNDHDFTYTTPDGREVESHISPDFEGRFHSNPYTINFAQQTDLWNEMVEDYPQIHFDILELNTHVKRRSQTASVLISLAITGVGHVVLNGMCELGWKHDGEKWVMNRHVVMRGPLLNESLHEAHDVII